MRRFLTICFLTLCCFPMICGADYPDMYLRGSEIGSNWGTVEDYKFTRTEGGHYELSVPVLSGQFKISNEDWSINLGATDEDHSLVSGPCTLEGVRNGRNYSAGNLKNVEIYFDLVLKDGRPEKTYVNFKVDGVAPPPIIVNDGKQPSGSLPVIYINTNNNEPITSKETYLKGTYYLDPKGVEGVEAIGSADSPLPLQIKGRGNFTWNSFDKKPYRLKLDKKAALLGMDSSKHFALLAHADDNRAFMRNLTGFEVSRMSGLSWTPGDKPCEVVLNGDYIGLYFLTETIRFDKKRINLNNPDDDVEDWLAANPGKTADEYPWTDEDYTGPWLIEFDNNPDEFQVNVPSRQRNGANIRVTYKTPEDYVTARHRDWLVKEIGDIDSRLYSSKGENDSWMDKVDLTDAARFFVVNQIMNNYECYSGSCYLTKDKGEGEKWHFGPVWDFGSAFQPSRDMTKWIFDSQYIQHWAKAMWDTPEFQAEVKRIFEHMDAEGFDRIFNYQNSYADRISVAAANDAKRWANKGYGNPDMEGPLAEVRKQLRDAIDSFGAKLGVEGYGEIEEPEEDIYLRGEMNGWDCQDPYKFDLVEKDVYELYVAELTGQFKIADRNWQLDFGYGVKSNHISELLELNKSYTLTEKGGNIKLSADPARNVLLRLNVSNNLFSVFEGTSVGNIGIETEDDPVYFNLQGLKVEHPEKGGVYIRVLSGKAKKVIY